MLGGGAVTTGSGLTVEDSHAFDYDDNGKHHSGWFVRVRNGSDGERAVAVFVVCANAS